MLAKLVSFLAADVVVRAAVLKACMHVKCFVWSLQLSIMQWLIVEVLLRQCAKPACAAFWRIQLDRRELHK